MALTRRGALELLGTFGGGALMPALSGVPALAQQRDFKIGVVASMTGPVSPFFKEYVDGFRAYVVDWNKRGGAIGRQVVLEVLDDESGAVQAANSYRRLAGDADTTLAWVAGTSIGGLAIKAIASELKLPVVSGGALDALGRPADPYFFKIAPANSDYLKLYFTWVKKRNFKRVAMLLSNDSYGQGEAQTAKELVGPLGLEIVALETFATTDTNFSSQLVRIRATQPDILYVGATGAPAILIYKQIRQFDLKYPLTMMLAGLTDAFFRAIDGAPNADGVTTPGLLGMLGSNAQGSSGALYSKLAAALGRPASLGNALGWDIGIVSEAAIAGSDGSRTGIRDALDRINDLPGIDGPITFKPTDHIGQDPRGMAVLQLSGGKFKYAE